MSSEKIPNEFSRREFAKAAALTTAAAFVTADLSAQETKPAPETSKAESAPSTTKLSPSSQAEADMAYETLMRKYGSRFTEEQKKEIRRLVSAQQGALDKLRSFSVSNSDEPASVFKPLVPGDKQ